MTLDETFRRIRWYVDAMEAKSGAADRGPLEVALSDHRAASDALSQIGIELARRYERAAND